MGHDISPIAKHNLNTENIENLAVDLFDRLDVNIEYGYYGDEVLMEWLGIKPNNDFNLIGKLTKNNKKDTFLLSDDSYLKRCLFNHFGNDVFNDDRLLYEYKTECINDDIRNYEISQIIFPTFDFSNLNQNNHQYLTIYKNLYSNDIPYYSRWFQICRSFVEDDFYELLNDSSFFLFRETLMNYNNLLGGEKMYYLDDQSAVLQGVGQGSEYKLDWSEFEKFVHEKSENLILDISKFLLNENYRKGFLSFNAYPLSFVDDFRDF